MDSPDDAESLRHEPLLRRFVPDSLSNQVPATAFRPTENDTTGISVSLENLPDPIGRVLAMARTPRERYSVCRFVLSGFDELSVSRSPEPHDPGHGTIPELAPPYGKLKNSDARKIKLREWQAELVRRSTVIHFAGMTLSS
jgi:hypothetical protein